MYYQKFKRTIIIFIAVSVVLVSFSQTAFGAIKSKINTPLTNKGPTNGLVAYWTFDGQDTTWTSATAGTTLDKSGNGNTGTLTNMSRSSSPVPGISGQGFRFDGVNDYVSESAIDLSATNVVTLSFWIKKDFSTPQGVTFELTTNFNVNTDGFLVVANSASPCVGYIQVAHKGDAGYSVGCYTRPSSSVWHYYTVIFDKSLSTNEVNLYIDGQLQTAVSRPYDNNNTNNFGNRPFYVMSRGGSSLFDSGTIDDVRIYNRALSASEIQELYRLGSARLKTNTASQGSQPLNSGLTGYWTFDGQDTTWTSATAGTTLDKSGNGNTGTLTNMSRNSSPAPGISGQGFRFDGVDDFISTGKLLSTFITASDASISTWVYPTGSSSTGGDCDRLQGIVEDPSGGYIWITRGIKSGTDAIWVGNYDGTNDCIPITYKVNQWIHIVLVHTGGTLFGYKDGALFGSIASGNTASLSTALGIGKGYSNGFIFNGIIDEVRIYNRALSASEVQELYNMGLKRAKFKQ